ncbi:MAG: cation-translocating P-type ATPase [Oscillospiraceae bacterium]
MLEILERKLVAEPAEPSPLYTMGLTEAEAQRRLKIDGENKLKEKKKKSVMKIFANQFHDVMVMILIAATAVSVLLGEITDAMTILVIIVLNAVLGFIQEFRTERTLEALEKMTAPSAKCYRDGRLRELPAAQLVAGDVFEIEAGDRIPCDAFIIAQKGLLCDESILTGEPVAAEKKTRAGELEYGTLNLPYVAYMGSVAVKGTARCEAVATGVRTQMGKVSDLISEIEEELTPLQKKLAELGKILAIICIVICFIVAAAGILKGEPAFSMLMTGITIAIAAIPEGLPATVTIALALAVRRMLKRNALVNRLHSVETLGCASVICTDKTGTITENKMTVVKIATASRDFDVTGQGTKIAGEIRFGEHPADCGAQTALGELLICAKACNNAVVTRSGISGARNRGSASSEWECVGDPTEIAILIAAEKGGARLSDRGLLRVDEIPFESETRKMTVVMKDDADAQTSYTKGAADVVVLDCGYILDDGCEEAFTPAKKRQILQRAEKMAADALRVMAFSKTENGRVVFLGLMGMLDPLRPEAKQAVKICARANIKTVMITGDHKLTACAIAKDAGILTDGMIALTGVELDKLTDAQLDEKIETVAVFARVNPADKLRIVRAFKRLGHVVAMTGDGVNDAPAVKEASIGVSMGISGTDVTKQASDVILLDDNLATLVSAVEQGRTIYANIRKFVRYLISCNIGEVLTMFVGILMGLPMVLIPVQILLINLVTDGLPAVALGLEPPEKSAMRKPPRNANTSFFSGGLMGRIFFRGVLIGLCTLACFVTVFRMTGSVEIARTGALFTLAASQLIHVFECKSEDKTLFNVPYLNNPFLIAAVLISLACLLAAIYLPILTPVFGTIPLNGTQLLVSLAFSACVPIFAGMFRR